MPPVDPIPLVSMLPATEPVLGLAFALNLAYLGLPRFRYRERIATDVKKVAKDNDIDLAQGSSSTDKWVAAISRLARVDKAKPKFFSRTPKKGFAGIWIHFYEWLYMCHIDRGIAFIFCSVAALLIALGAVHSTGAAAWQSTYYSADAAVGMVYVSLLMMTIPVLMVIVGNWVVDSAIEAATDEIENIATNRQKTVGEVADPKKAATA